MKSNNNTEFVRASAVYRLGGIIAYPAEAVWGLAGNPMNINAIHKVQIIKNRVDDKKLIIVASDLYYFRNFVSMAYLLENHEMLSGWPGPTTWVVPASKSTPRHLVARDGTIAIRFTNDPSVKQLCLFCNGALFSTSANLSGDKPIRDYKQFMLQFSGAVDCVISGEVGGLANPTPIRLVSNGEYIRT
ncbi:MAG: Sua5/YciO/YrdC/YwlC family protein [Methylacidiphilales bacterium]|nr:Sua5/YciO/YrdC/YwlC family protein [Candidatus Methylacidiphilales bacterium]